MSVCIFCGTDPTNCFRLSRAAMREARKQARADGLSLSDYIAKAIKTDVAVAKISREKIG